MRDILDGFLEELQERPYSKITISGICRRTGVIRKTFYRHFYGKQECLLAVIDRHLLVSYEEAVQYGLQQYFVYWWKHQDFLQLLKVNNLYPLFFRQAVLFAEKRNFANRDESQICFVVTGVLCVIVQWVERGCEETFDYLGQELQKILHVPLAALLSNEENAVRD